MIPVAQETGLPLDLLTDLHDFYWNDVHKLLTSLEHSHVVVPYVGTFNIRSADVLEETIEKLNKFNRRSRENPPKTMKAYARFIETEKDIERLNKLLVNIRSERIERDRIKEIRKDVRKAKEALGEPGADL